MKLEVESFEKPHFHAMLSSFYAGIVEEWEKTQRNIDGLADNVSPILNQFGNWSRRREGAINNVEEFFIRDNINDVLRQIVSWRNVEEFMP